MKKFVTSLPKGPPQYDDSTPMEERVKLRRAKQKLELGYAHPGLRRGKRPDNKFVGDPHRFVAICRVPWLEPNTGRVEYGFHCLGCGKPNGGGCGDTGMHGPRGRGVLYTPELFAEHLEKYGLLEDGKHTLWEYPKRWQRSV